ncbi:MAG: UDP-2,4-diacetamido-2,4,6-trideoxy-beta-L-altropyranose hydrolase [Polaribacter sp.]
MRRKILFRADGDKNIGYGHVIRSLALADMLKEEFECVFVTRFINDFLQNEINKVCKKIILLSNEDEESHFEEFLQLLNGDEIVVLDNYFFTTAYQKKIKNKKSTLVCIDDLANKHFVCDAIINHIDISVYKKYSTEKYTKLHLGMQNALLRKEFFEEKLNIKKENLLLVAFGGVDVNNLTFKYLKTLLNNKLEVKICVIINKENSKYDNIFKLTSEYSNLEILSNLSAKEMKSLMEKTKVAIFPSSSICIEGLVLSVNIVSGYYVENQKYAYKFFLDNNLVLGLGNLNQINEKQLITLVKANLKQDNLNTEIINSIKTSKINHIRNFKMLANGY